MNYLVLSKIYKIIEEDLECENNQLHNITVKNYEELEEKLIKYGYDFTPGEILIDVKNGNNIEEALSKPKSLVLTSDNTKITYLGTKFLIKWFCDKQAVIEIKDDKKYCKECFEQNSKQQISFKKIKSILDSKDEMYGLSTSKK
jgi:hypothetical protein